MSDEKEGQPRKDAGEIVIDFGQGKISFTMESTYKNGVLRTKFAKKVEQK